MSEPSTTNTTKNFQLVCFLEGAQVPSSRFRIEQYVKALSQEEQQATKLLYTWPNKYLWAPGVVRKSFLYPLWATICVVSLVIQRIFQILLYVPSATNIIIQRDLLHRIPSVFLERLIRLCAGKQTIILFDVDDAIHIGKEDEGDSRQRKMESIAKLSTRVIAGNSFLSDFYSQYSETILIPTVINLDRYKKVSETGSDNEIVLGWTGVSSNLHYLKTLEPVLNELAESHRIKLQLLCEAGAKPPFADNHFPIKMVPWSPENEVTALYSFDIGLMPLSDSRWSRGKCGFKLLQYMACGIPAVASPIGVNNEIVSSGENGFLASSHEEWRAQLEQLLSSQELRREIGGRARRTVEKKYSLKEWLPIWKSAVFGRD